MNILKNNLDAIGRILEITFAVIYASIMSNFLNKNNLFINLLLILKMLMDLVILSIMFSPFFIGFLILLIFYRSWLSNNLLFNFK